MFDGERFQPLACLVQGQGAADAGLSPIVMQKGRPAHTVSVLAPPDAEASVRDLLPAVTSSIGCRTHVVTKHALARVMTGVEIAGYPIAVKVATDGGVIVQAMPEFDDVARAAAALGRPVRDVLAQAQAEVRAAGLLPGSAAPLPGGPGGGDR